MDLNSGVLEFLAPLTLIIRLVQ
ncbi:hypothetical protein THICB2_630039 [Thiomonas sp. CB2]|nr:hypothetical protein THICB2_630039 [Thiomonas sp. CB2]